MLLDSFVGKPFKTVLIPAKQNAPVVALSEVANSRDLREGLEKIRSAVSRSPGYRYLLVAVRI